MTAVVGILNKHAVAIAADSAVTIDNGNGHKIFNKANKVFTLSKFHPVGIMIYNSASFMGAPWEMIIKVYRKQLGTKSFPTVKEYQFDFLEFIRSNHFFTTPDKQLAWMRSFADANIKGIINEVAKVNDVLIRTPNTQNNAAFMDKLETQLDFVIRVWTTRSKSCPEFQGYTFDLFKRYSSTIFDEIASQRFLAFGYLVSAAFLDKMKQYIFQLLLSDATILHFTGLVFVGFGDSEFYPCLIPINIAMAVDNRIRYFVDDEKSALITDENQASVCPFAQTDVIDTILAGIDPSLDDVYQKNFASFLQVYNQQILQLIGPSNQQLAAQIAQLDSTPIIQAFAKEIEKVVNQQYIHPLLSAVSNLSKDDLAEMAESLIYLTYLKRRITFAEESVGGPVDVAVISKGDGFVWIKRKHYFKPELNQHFFDNYLRH